MTEITNTAENEKLYVQNLQKSIIDIINEHNIMRNSHNKDYQELEDSLSDSDKELLERYMAMTTFSAKMYLSELRDHIKHSLNYNLEHGICTFKAPLGYVNYRDKNSRAQIKVDSACLQKIYKLFLARRDGASLKDLYQLAKDMKLTTSKSQVLRILHNPFYCGKFIIKGKLYTHSYPIVVPETLFEEVQQTFRK